jgi:hypothetical protein
MEQITKDFKDLMEVDELHGRLRAQLAREHNWDAQERHYRSIEQQMMWQKLIWFSGLLSGWLGLVGRFLGWW